MKQQEPSSLTCRQLLSLSLMNDAVLLAGELGLDQVIRRVNVMEVPDVTDWVQPGEFLMTTGYPFRKRPEALLTLIRELSRKGVVALGVKTKRFLDELPVDVIQLANELKFPLIELPPQTVFSEVIHEVMEYVLSFEMYQLTVLQDRMQKITALLLGGGEIPALIEGLEKWLANPVMFLDMNHHLLLTPTTGNLLFTDEADLREWTQQFVTAVTRSSPDSDHVTLTLEIGQRAVDVYVSFIRMSYGRRCCLILLSFHRSLSDVDLLTIERANPIVLLELMNIEARNSVEHKYKDQFIRDWLYGRFENAAELRVRAQVCGYPIVQPARFAVAILKTVNPATVTRQLREQVSGVDAVMIYPIQVDHEVVLVLQWSASPNASNASLAALKKGLPGVIAALMDDAFSLYLGKEVVTECLHDSFVEAKRVVQIASECNIEQSILTYDDLGVYPVLFVLPECAEVEQFKKKYLQPLLDFENNHQLNIIETLDTYFQCNQNMRLTAEKLFTHYNTVVYRMEKIRTLLGFDLDLSDTRLHLHLALKLYHLEQSKKRRIDESLFPG